MTNNSEEQQTSSSTKETIIEVIIQPPTTEAKVESDAPPAVITTQPAQPMPEHDDSIAVVMWEATVSLPHWLKKRGTVLEDCLSILFARILFLTTTLLLNAV